jgi:hypothetical protein
VLCLLVFLFSESSAILIMIVPCFIIWITTPLNLSDQIHTTTIISSFSHISKFIQYSQEIAENFKNITHCGWHKICKKMPMPLRD